MKIYTSSAFVAGLVVGIMVLPIVTSITRQVFALAPPSEREGALALGASRWDVIRTVVLPFGRGGMVGAIFLGLGRALGETIAITMIVSPTFAVCRHVLQAGANSIAAHITLRFGTGGSLGLSALLAAGFTLFVVTLAANLAGAAVGAPVAERERRRAVTLVATDRPELLPAGPPPQPNRPNRFTRADAGLLAGSALAGICLVWLVFDQLTLLSGAEGFVLCAYIAALVFYGVTSTMLEGWSAAKDRSGDGRPVDCGGRDADTAGVDHRLRRAEGLPLPRLALLREGRQGRRSAHPPTAAGGLHAIIGTLEQNGLAVLIGGPLAIMTAVFLNEVGGRLTHTVRTVVTAMSGIPSIVAGLFIYTVWVQHGGHRGDYSGFAAALALTVILLPTVTRTTEEVLRLVPGGLREASMALGASEGRTAWSVVLPSARSGVVTAVLLGVAFDGWRDRPGVLHRVRRDRDQHEPVSRARRPACRSWCSS